LSIDDCPPILSLIANGTEPHAISRRPSAIKSSGMAVSTMKDVSSQTAFIWLPVHPPGDGNDESSEK
jgi:hypothetical protein